MLRVFFLISPWWALSLHCDCQLLPQITTMCSTLWSRIIIMSAFLLLLYPVCKHGRSWRNRCPYFLPSRFYFITIFLSVSVGLVPACLAVLFILTVHLRSAADKKRLLSIMRYIYIYIHACQNIYSHSISWFFVYSSSKLFLLCFCVFLRVLMSVRRHWGKQSASAHFLEFRLIIVR